jgi:hypothetical protein
MCTNLMPLRGDIAGINKTSKGAPLARGLRIASGRPVGITWDLVSPKTTKKKIAWAVMIADPEGSGLTIMQVCMRIAAEQVRSDLSLKHPTAADVAPGPDDYQGERCKTPANSISGRVLGI